MAQRIEIIGVFIPCRDCEIPSRFSAWASSRTPPSEVILPPSNAALTFLPEMAGNDGKTGAGSIMAAGRLLSGVKDGFNTNSLRDIRRLRYRRQLENTSLMNNPG